MSVSYLAALGGNPRGTVNVTPFTSYIKLVGKSSCVILERALKSVRLWSEFKTKQQQLFAAHGLQHCVIMWNLILANAQETAPDDVPMQLAYLRGYFFSQYSTRISLDRCSSTR